MNHNPEMPEAVRLHLSCLPANLREVRRGLEAGMFGPPVPLESPKAQQWTNAAMAMVTVEIAIEAVEYLQQLREAVALPTNTP